MQLRYYQLDIERDIYKQWQVYRNVLAVLPTGAGKTVLFSKILNDFNGYSIAIAHRQELVAQISIALASFGIKHNIIAQEKTVKTINVLHVMLFGKTFFDPNAPRAVAGVDTLTRRATHLRPFLQKVGLWVMDEGHHVLASNKWGTAVALFPNAYGLGVTATPERADGKGLGRHADGLYDVLSIGAGMRTLINEGYLTDYRIFAPPSDLDLTGVETSNKTGDFITPQVKKRMEKSHIVGDVVKHYLRLAPGKLGITFAIDVEMATEIAANYNKAGVPAEVVSAKTPDRERIEILRRFRAREILQLVNVDLFGEGFDLPAIEVCSFARPTQSYALYVQQFGRALRILDGKLIAIIIDHVSNVIRHGLPDAPRIWSLDGREKQSGNGGGALALKVCPECTAPYYRYLVKCPYCGHYAEPSNRSKPEFVDGDLLELTPEVLALMRGEQTKVDGLCYPPGHLEEGAKIAVRHRHAQRQTAQLELRNSIAVWAGGQRAQERTDRESYKLFYLTFGIDVLSAQALGKQDANILNEKITEVI